MPHITIVNVTDSFVGGNQFDFGDETVRCRTGILLNGRSGTGIAGNVFDRNVFHGEFVQDYMVSGGKCDSTNAIVGSVSVAYSAGAAGVQLTGSGDGSPEGAVTAAAGSVYMRTDEAAGARFYVKESGRGATGWVAK